MGRQDPNEDVEDDDDMEFLAAAQQDDDLVARILIHLSYSGTPSNPLQPTSPSPATEGVARPLLPPETRWGGRRTRSRSMTMEGILAAKMEEEAAAAAARRASPMTPLSWSGGSGSSGSLCGDGWPAPSPPPKRQGEPSSGENGESRQEAELCYSGERIRAPPAKGLTEESHGEGDPHRDSVVRVPASAPGVAVFSGYGSKNKAEEVAVGGPETSRTAAQVELQRVRWTGLGSVGFRRPGKKKKVVELHALEESLLQEQEQLQKELVKHKEIYYALLEENVKLKKVESGFASHMVSKRTATYVSCEEAANSGCPQHVESTSESQTVDELSRVSVIPEEDRCEQLPCTSSPVSVPGRAFLFDLNCLPDEHV